MVNLIQEYRPYGIRITDLSSQLWCEKQLEFSLEKGKKETEVMSKGKERHTELHEEIATLVEVEPKTIADHVALKLYNIKVGLTRLTIEGMTRELPIFGKINSLFVVGTIDELNLVDNQLFITDTKTRQRDTMPSEAQKRTTRFQLMLYNKLIQDCVCGKFCTTELLNFYGFKQSDEISNDLRKQFMTLRIKLKQNIKKLADESFGLFQLLPIPEKTLNIRYEFQQNRKSIGIDKFSFEQSVFQRNCNFVEEYWLGKRKAVPVGINNMWKCKFCEFNDICEEKSHALT